MKKILIINDSLGRGGAERVMVYLSEYFVRHNVLCELLTFRVADKEYPLPEKVTRVCVSGNPLKKIVGLRKAVKRSGADTVLIMGTPLCIYAIPALVGLKVKVVVSERNDPTHFDGKKIVKIVSQRLIRFADDFVFQTEDAKAYYSKRLKGRGCVIYNPLFTDGLPDAYVGERAKRIVSAGRLMPQKNQSMLIDAFAKIHPEHPDYRLVIYGEGKLRCKLQEQIDRLGLQEKICLPGSCSDVLEQMKDAALFVLPSNFEGMPNVLIEAMALGLPCISTDCPCGGPRELIRNGVDGVLVPVGNAETLACEISRVLNDPELSALLGKNATQIRERLDVEKIGKEWLTFFS